MAQSEIVDSFIHQFIFALKDHKGATLNSLLLGSIALRSYRNKINTTVDDANPNLGFTELTELRDKIYKEKIDQDGSPNYRESSSKGIYFFKKK